MEERTQQSENPLEVRLKEAKVYSSMGLFEESRDPISVTTPEGDFVEANKAFLELFGYERGELSTLDAEELYAEPADRERLLEAVRREGGVTEFKVKLRTKTSEPRICEISTTLIEADEGEEEHLQMIVRDVTDRNRLEEQLRNRDQRGIVTIRQRADGSVVFRLKGDDRVERVKVLVYRESRGWEVRHDFFTTQFTGATLQANERLDRPIDGISGATLSVRAVTRLTEIALLLHRHVTQAP